MDRALGGNRPMGGRAGKWTSLYEAHTPNIPQFGSLRKSKSIKKCIRSFFFNFACRVRWPNWRRVRRIQRVAVIENT